MVLSTDLVLCLWWWSKLTRFLDAGRKSFGLCVSIEIDMVSVGVVDIDLTPAWTLEFDFISV